ncbi:hypothetical protein A6R68_03515, partial [Neotoma lepida]
PTIRTFLVGGLLVLKAECGQHRRLWLLDYAGPQPRLLLSQQNVPLGNCKEPVHRHLDGHEVRYLQFAFRWMNNLLMRELPLRCTIRLWDTYQNLSALENCLVIAESQRGEHLAERREAGAWASAQSEPEGFSHFHLYVCAAFLVRWRREILEERDF